MNKTKFLFHFKGDSGFTLHSRRLNRLWISVYIMYVHGVCIYILIKDYAFLIKNNVTLPYYHMGNNIIRNTERVFWAIFYIPWPSGCTEPVG